MKRNPDPDLPAQREELQRVRKEIQRTYDLYQQEKLDADGFSKFYTPLEERRKQLEAELPRLEAEVDILKVNNLSAEEIASQASNLYDNWQTMKPEEKREIIEVITDKIIIGKDEITINLSHSPSCKDMAKGARKGWDSCPKSPFSKTIILDFIQYSSGFCHYLKKSVLFVLPQFH
jgi:site-specific DNA recombinase